MKNLLFAIFILLSVSCSETEESATFPKTTFTKKDSSLANDLIVKLQFVEKGLIERGITDSIKNRMIDELQTQVLDYQFDVVHLKTIELKISKIEKENIKYFAQLDSLRLKNLVLQDSNKSILKILSIEKTNSKKTLAENKKLKESIKFKVVNFSVKSYNKSKNIFSKSKDLEVDLADKTKFIKVSFIITGHENIEFKNYKITISLFGVDELKSVDKEVIFKFENKDQNIEILFDNLAPFMAGKHKISIKIDNNIIHTGFLTLK